MAVQVNLPALEQQQWSEGVEAEVLKKTKAFEFIAKRSDALLQWKDELTDKPGDNFTIGLRLQLSNSPRTSGQTLEGQERTLQFHSDSMSINEMADAVRFENVMDRQRVGFDMRDEARAALADQFANAIDTSFFNQIAGYALTTPVDATFRGNNTVTAPASSRHIFADPANNTAESTLQDTADDYFVLTLIDRAVQRAKTTSPAIRPVRIEGLGEVYVCFIHPVQTTQLRNDGSQWDQLNTAMLEGGYIRGNPIVTGALGVYNGTLLCESSRVPTGVSSGVSDTDTRRAIFCGAQAAAISWGRLGGTPMRYRWAEESFDYDREYGISAGCLVGIKKLIFNSVDFATIVISTGAAVVT